MEIKNIRTKKDFELWFYGAELPTLAVLKVQHNQNKQRLEKINKRWGI
jgi:hypothetical protein